MITRLFKNPLRLLIFIVAAVAMQGLLLPSDGHASWIPSQQTNYSSPLLIPVALKCSRLGRQNGREILINSCGSCRIVGIQRKRPGNDAPISRTVTIPSRARVALSFRGPGQSRITSDVACKASARTRSAAPNSARNDNRKCIQLSRSPKGLALANTCDQCRAAVVERLDTRGGKRMQTIFVDGGKTVKLPAMGAAYARVLTEKNCK